FEVPLYGQSHFAADAALTAMLLEAASAYCAGAEGQLGAEKVALFGLKKVQAHHGLLVAGDRFVATAAESHALRSALPGVLAVDMESAAVAQVCFDYHIPFAAVRTISDRADDAAHVDFPLFLAQLAAPYAQGIIGGSCICYQKNSCMRMLGGRWRLVWLKNPWRVPISANPVCGSTTSAPRHLPPSAPAHRGTPAPSPARA
nr:hypothetical protein [Burkholderiaceae bacterium]